MKVKTYKKFKIFLFAVVFSAMLFSIKLGSALPALFGVGSSMVLLSLLKIKVKGALIDERTQKVSSQASQTSFQILLPILLLSSLALILGGSNEEFHYIKSLGIILSYITCLGLIIYLIAYRYFDKKTGGK